MKKSKALLILLILIMLAFVVLVLVLMNTGVIPTIFDLKERSNNREVVTTLGKVDDWCFDPSDYSYNESFSSKGFFSTSADGVLSMDTATAGSNLGLSVGGAKDINNFRENIENGYFPIQSDITYEGIFYDYSFDTGNKGKEETDKLFYPTYSTAISKDPFSENEEYYVSVGLNSNIKEEDFARKKLNLMIVLDISGSMDSMIDSYYYDGLPEDYNEKEQKSKMEVAEEAINVLLDQLKPEDSLGVVLFDDGAYLGKPISVVDKTDIEAIKEHILEIKAMGGTNFEAGIELAKEQFDEFGIKDKSEYENRMIVITDAMPNIGETSKEGLRKTLEDYCDEGIYTTFIGVGVDFNTDVIKNITDIEGANYYSVASEDEFKTRMGEEFEYMVTPLVFDLDLSLDTDSFEIEKIYGTDSKSSEDGNIMHVNTLFPSASNEEGEVKGGIILLKLKKLNDEGNLNLKVSYRTREGREETTSSEVKFEKNEEYYDNSGIRKGILLTRYVNIIKNWIEYERKEEPKYLITSETGIIDCLPDINYSSENERSSVKLTVSEKSKEIFDKFLKYFEIELDEVNDESLFRESDLLNKLKDM